MFKSLLANFGFGMIRIEWFSFLSKKAYLKYITNTD